MGKDNFCPMCGEKHENKLICPNHRDMRKNGKPARPRLVSETRAKELGAF